MALEFEGSVDDFG